MREATPEDAGEEERPAVDVRAAFRCIVGALARKAAGLPFQGFPSTAKVLARIPHVPGIFPARL